ncbi:uncharacterized protein LOC117342457 [Pecten maximus]|uniref:uncharacterized protein LOC117342457 n=1 Tax=Pecten maximus TaxID=6579 RepID=UPI0014589EA1|nr:uncharacterized protein LOC117342457 [Pecten maximus]
MLQEEMLYNRYTESNDARTYTPKADKEDLTWWKNRPSSAHLHLDNSDDKMKWTFDPKFVTSFKSDDIKLNGTKMEVSERGMYFIYSTISVEFSKMKSRPVE